MRFVDQATIVAVAGDGGSGSRHFRREKHVPRGGPDGGDGGRGGDVVLQASNRARSLLDFHYKRHHKAAAGKPGGTARKTGKSAEALVLYVPLGTSVIDDDTGEVLADLVAQDQRAVVAKGGNGGWGNIHFKSATRQAPERANPGLPGEQRTLRLELKLLADVALVGYPNAGKSTLIRRISASKAEVGDYPFTTLVPNLGVVRHRGKTFTVADVPGLVRGAASGAGLGIRFLRHVERCEVLVFLLAADHEEEPAEQLDALRHELASHASDLLQRPAVIAVSKSDVTGPEIDQTVADTAAATGAEIIALSSATGAGVATMLDRMIGLLPAADAVDQDAPWDPLS